jgi:excisionase family DNA binding protein
MCASSVVAESDDRLGIRIKEVAKRLGMSKRALERLMAAGKAPPTYKLGGVVVFRATDLVEWAALGFCDRAKFEAAQRARREGRGRA